MFAMFVCYVCLFVYYGNIVQHVCYLLLLTLGVPPLNMDVPGMIAPPPPAPQKVVAAPPRPAKIDKIRVASRGKVDCAVDSDIRI